MKWMTKIMQRKEQLLVFNSYNTVKKYSYDRKDKLRQKDYEHQSNNQLKGKHNNFYLF